MPHSPQYVLHCSLNLLFDIQAHSLGEGGWVFVFSGGSPLSGAVISQTNCY